MLRVRFPNGQCIRYNTATWCQRGDNGWQLYTKKPDDGGTWVASIQISAGAVVEAIEACAVTNPITGQTPSAAARLVLQHLRTLPTDLAKDLKLALRPFNARSHTWRT